MLTNNIGCDKMFSIERRGRRVRETKASLERQRLVKVVVAGFVFVASEPRGRKAERPSRTSP